MKTINRGPERTALRGFCIQLPYCRELKDQDHEQVRRMKIDILPLGSVSSAGTPLTTKCWKLSSIYFLIDHILERIERKLISNFSINRLPP